jgi:hypothetical protein
MHCTREILDFTEEGFNDKDTGKVRYEKESPTEMSENSNRVPGGLNRYLE